MTIKKLHNIAQGLIKSETFIFILGKYFSYFLIFLNSLLIAKLIGPYQYGIWGFVLLVLNYLGYSNFGVQYSVNVLLSTEDRTDNTLMVKINSNAILSTLFFSILIASIGIILYSSGVNLFDKYEFKKYLLLVLLIASLSNFNKLFMNVFRSFGKFYQILGYLILPQLLILTMLFLGTKEKVIYYMLVGDLIGNFIAIVIYTRSYPLKLKLAFDKIIMKEVLLKGLSLLLYNASFYFILLSSRTIVSIFYDVKSLGLFSFANSIAQSAVFILSVISFVFFPKILHKLKKGINNEEVYLLLKQLREYYVTSSNFIVISVLLAYPLLLLFLKGYENSLPSFLFLILTQLIIVNAYGYSTLIIANGYEKRIAVFAIITVLLNVLISILFVVGFKLSFQYVAFATLISTNYYTFSVVRFGRKLLFLPISFIDVLKEVFPLRILLPYLILLVSGFSKFHFVFIAIGAILFLALNYKFLIQSVKVFIKVMHNPNSTKF